MKPDEDSMEDRVTLPILPIRGFFAYPGQSINFDVNRLGSLRALEKAVKDGTEILLGVQKDAMQERPGKEDLLDVVVSMRINKLFKEERVVRLQGDVLTRYLLVDFNPDGRGYQATVEKIEVPEVPPEEEQALRRELYESFEQYAEITSIVPQTMLRAMSIRHAGDMADLIAANLSGEYEDKYDIYMEIDPMERARKVYTLLKKEKKISQYRARLQAEVGKELREIQRESFLREELQTIQRQLGEADQDDLSDGLNMLLLDPGIPAVVKQKVEFEQKRLRKLPPMSQEAGLIQDYLDRIAEIPWKSEKDSFGMLDWIEKRLDRDHYGMERVKRRIVEFVAAKTLKPDVKSPVLCLVGPPGVGKTSIASSIATVLNRPYVRVSLGGVRDEAEIRGHRRTYVGAMPGRIVSAMIQAKSSKPVMLLDEIDKMASDLRGDPTAALLEVLDLSLNHEFRDAYTELPLDLSNVFFIATANALEGIPLPLMDRMEIIELESYSRQEKLEIATKYLLPKQRKEYGLKVYQLKLSQDALERIIAEYTREAGVRELERLIGSLCRKAARMIVEGSKKSLTVTDKNLASLMDEPPVKEDDEKRKPECGVVNGLAWTSLGGEVLTVETAVLEGSGKLELTGQMGDVMKESAQIALSVVRSHAIPERDAKYYKEHDVHVHIPAGAVPKDGPSAGVTLATAMYSALSGHAVRSDLAMTGELSLRGRVLPIGGLKEKILAARQKGIQEVLVPDLNRPDVEKLPDHVTEGMDIRYMQHIDEVWKEAVLSQP